MKYIYIYIYRERERCISLLSLIWPNAYVTNAKSGYTYIHIYIYIYIEREREAYNEGAPNRVPLNIPMKRGPRSPGAGRRTDIL